MIQRNLILIIFILVFSACGKITKEDIKGNWTADPKGNDELIFWEISFEDHKAQLITDNFFKESGNFRVEKGNLIINLKRDDLIVETKIQKLDKDTLVIFDNLTYRRNKESINANFEEYELIDIQTNEYLADVGNFFFVIHFYKSESEEVKIRLADKILDFNEILIFLPSGHTGTRVLVFIGEGIKLSDLRNLYYALASSHQNSILLATKKEGISITHIFRDKIEIWWDDLENHFIKSNLPPLSLSPPQLNLDRKIAT